MFLSGENTSVSEISHHSQTSNQQKPRVSVSEPVKEDTEVKLLEKPLDKSGGKRKKSKKVSKVSKNAINSEEFSMDHSLILESQSFLGHSEQEMEPVTKQVKPVPTQVKPVPKQVKPLTDLIKPVMEQPTESDTEKSPKRNSRKRRKIGLVEKVTPPKLKTIGDEVLTRHKRKKKHSSDIEAREKTSKTRQKMDKNPELGSISSGFVISQVHETQVSLRHINEVAMTMNEDKEPEGFSKIEVKDIKLLNSDDEPDDKTVSASDLQQYFQKSTGPNYIGADNTGTMELQIKGTREPNARPIASNNSEPTEPNDTEAKSTVDVASITEVGGNRNGAAKLQRKSHPEESKGSPSTQRLKKRYKKFDRSNKKVVINPSSESSQCSDEGEKEEKEEKEGSRQYAEILLCGSELYISHETSMIDDLMKEKALIEKEIMAENTDTNTSDINDIEKVNNTSDLNIIEKIDVTNDNNEILKIDNITDMVIKETKNSKRVGHTNNVKKDILDMMPIMETKSLKKVENSNDNNDVEKIVKMDNLKDTIDIKTTKIKGTSNFMKIKSAMSIKENTNVMSINNIVDLEEVTSDTEGVSVEKYSDNHEHNKSQVGPQAGQSTMTSKDQMVGKFEEVQAKSSLRSNEREDQQVENIPRTEANKTGDPVANTSQPYSTRTPNNDVSGISTNDFSNDDIQKASSHLVRTSQRRKTFILKPSSVKAGVERITPKDVSDDEIIQASSHLVSKMNGTKKVMRYSDQRKMFLVTGQSTPEKSTTTPKIPFNNRTNVDPSPSRTRHIEPVINKLSPQVSQLEPSQEIPEKSLSSVEALLLINPKQADRSTQIPSFDELIVANEYLQEPTKLNNEKETTKLNNEETPERKSISKKEPWKEWAQDLSLLNQSDTGIVIPNSSPPANGDNNTIDQAIGKDDEEAVIDSSFDHTIVSNPTSVSLRKWLQKIKLIPMPKPSLADQMRMRFQQNGHNFDGFRSGQGSE